jgi:hypothetical protein
MFALCLVLTAALLASRQSWAAYRVAVLVSAENGMDGEHPLTHVQEDASRLEETLLLLSNFSPANIHRLDGTSPKKVLQKLNALAEDMKRIKGEKLLLFYYSGHADATSLHLEGEELAYDTLLKQLQEFPADLKIGIIDACKSGAIIGKGSSTRTSLTPVVDILKTKGTVVITSSRGEQDSWVRKSLKSSVFSHHLISGMRGAADMDADGKVSLDEAYRYAELNTRFGTRTHVLGEQAPQRESLDVLEDGPVILTWLEMARARLTLPPGRGVCFITTENEKRLIAESPSELERELHFALKPASTYVLKCRRDGTRFRKVSFSMKVGEEKKAAALELKEVAEEDILRKGVLPDPEQLCTFDIVAQSLFVERDQRTNVANLEGLVELRGRFSADDIRAPVYPSVSTVVTARRGESLKLNQFLTRVTVDKAGTVPLGAELWEVEYGVAGEDDYGRQSGALHLDCSREREAMELPVPISADTLFEKSGSVIVQYAAIRR